MTDTLRTHAPAQAIDDLNQIVKHYRAVLLSDLTLKRQGVENAERQLLHDALAMSEAVVTWATGVALRPSTVTAAEADQLAQVFSSEPPLNPAPLSP
jgi:hypothetical protein